MAQGIRQGHRTEGDQRAFSHRQVTASEKSQCTNGIEVYAVGCKA